MSSKLEKVSIMGIGGGAGNIVKTVAKTYAARWTQLAYLDTDVDDLEYADGVLHVPLGRNWTHDQGAGDDPLLGQRATESSLPEIREVLGDTQLLIIVACLGGGTGSGGAPVVTRLAKELGILTFCLVGLPLAGEGNGPRQIADKALATLRQQTEVVIAVPGDLLFAAIPPDTPATHAFQLANDILAEGLVGLAEVVRCRGVIPIDFASLKTVFKQKDAHCAFGIGKADRDQSIEHVIDNLFASPLLGGRDFVDQADVVVATLLGGERLQIGILNETLSRLNDRLPTTARAFLGANHVSELGDGLRLTMLAVRYRDPAARPASARSKRQAKLDNTRQFKLPFVEDAGTVGLFGNTTPTMVRGENLDIPTFQRRGIELDVDEP